MNPDNIPFNALIVGPTNSGKTRFMVDQLTGPFLGKFDYIVLICPTFTHNKTLFRKKRSAGGCNNLRAAPGGVLVEEGTNTLIILDDCAASKVKQRTGQLVHLAFSARHIGLSVLVLTQKYTSITASFREKIAPVVLFYNPSAKTTKALFEDYAGDLPQEEYKKMVSKLKQRKFSYLVFHLAETFFYQ